MTDQDTPPEGLPADETEAPPSPNPTDARTDPAEAEREARRIDADTGLSPASEQPGAAAITGVGSRAADRLFRD